jgi:protein TonB
MSAMSRDEENEMEEGFFRRHRIAIGMGLAVVLLIGAGFSAYLISGKPSPPRQIQEIAIHLEPPPPPPLPPPPPPKIPPPVQKMVEQPPVKPQESKPKPEAKIDRPPGPPGPKASGPPTELGLAGDGGGEGGDGSGDGGGSKYGWYAAEVQTRIAEALRQNSKTQSANLQLKIRIWADSAGRITRAELASSSGDPAIDAAIRNEVLLGLLLPDPPPQDMPMPIVMRVTARRPA